MFGHTTVLVLKRIHYTLCTRQLLGTILLYSLYTIARRKSNIPLYKGWYNPWCTSNILCCHTSCTNNTPIDPVILFFTTPCIPIDQIIHPSTLKHGELGNNSSSRETRLQRHEEISLFDIYMCSCMCRIYFHALVMNELTISNKGFCS